MKTRLRRYATLVPCLAILILTLTGCSLTVTQTTVPAVTTPLKNTTLPPVSTAAAITASTPVETFSKPQSYHAIRTITIKNDSASIKALRLWLPAVSEWESQRNVRIESLSVTGNYWQDPVYGTKGLFIEVNNAPAAGTSLVITEEFSFTSYETNYQITPALVQPYDKTTSEYLLNTKSQYFIESDDPGIVKAAAEIKGSETNPYKIARLFNDWVKQHMNYQLVGGLKGAKFALENGYGECGDYTCLFVALCRASGIPAHPVVGRWANSKKNDWHVWPEFYLPGYGWIPCDPTVEDTNGGNCFGHMDNQRLIFNKQCDVALQPTPTFFPGTVAILQTWLWEYEGQNGTVNVDVDYTINPVTEK